MSQPIHSTSAVRRSAFAALAALAVWVAAPARAAEVVEIRIGNHPTFTRVVFELDRASGYRVQREGGASGTELVVTLNASSGARSIRSKSPGVDRVEVKPGGAESVARIGLRKKGLRLKEMILANPPRIVLDVMYDEAMIAKLAPKPKPQPVVAKPAETAPEIAKAKPASDAAKSPEPAKQPAPEPAKQPAPEIAKKAEPEPAKKPEPELAKAKTPEPAVAKPPAPAPAAETAKVAKPAAEPRLAKEPEPAPEAKVAKKAETPVADAKVAKAPELPTPTLAPKPAKPPEPAAEVANTPTTPTPAPDTKAAAATKAPGEAAKAEPVAEREAEGPVPVPTPAPGPQMAKTPTGPEPAIADAKPADKPLAPTTPAGKPTRATPSDRAKTGTPGKQQAARATSPSAKVRASSWLSEWLRSPVVLGAGGGLLVCVIGFVFLMRRRRTLPTNLDVTAIAEESGGAGAAAEPHAGADASFADLFDDEPQATKATPPARRDAGRPEREAGPATPPARRDAGPATPPARRDTGPATPPARRGASDEASFDNLFGDAEAAPAAKGDAPMTRASDLPADPGRTTAPARASTAAPDTDVLRVVHELERRMAALESKLAESNEARERLERQVAAQSEELRVQRAAIARTQRALRTMSRGDEDKATEPALRDGDTQTRTRANPQQQ
jgi:uncharacterized coiled-coil protein SlyX